MSYICDKSAAGVAKICTRRQRAWSGMPARGAGAGVRLAACTARDEECPHAAQGGCDWQRARQMTDDALDGLSGHVGDGIYGDGGAHDSSFLDKYNGR